MAVRRSDANFSHSANDALGDRGKLWLRATGADHKRLSDGGEATDVQDKDVSRLLLFREEGYLSRKVVRLDGRLLFG
jgi:hypothetical protein